MPLDNLAVPEREVMHDAVLRNALAVVLVSRVKADRAVHVVSACREITRLEASELRRFCKRPEKTWNVLFLRYRDVPRH